jgi:hypothetical protein
MASANPTVIERDAQCGCRIRMAHNPAEPAHRRLWTPVEWGGRRGCAEHGHDDHREHFKRLLTADHVAARAKHGLKFEWVHVHEDPISGAIRDTHPGRIAKEKAGLLVEED